MEGGRARDNTGGGKGSRPGAHLGADTHKVADLAGADHAAVVVNEATTVPFPPFRIRDGVAPRQDDPQPASPFGPTGQPRPPRVPVVDNPCGGRAAEQSERLSLLATAILLACLRNRGPRAAMEAAGTSERHEQPAFSIQRDTRASKPTVSRTSAAGRKAAVPKEGPAGASARIVAAATALASASSPGARSKRRRSQGAGTTTVVAAALVNEKTSKAQPRRTRRRHRSLPSWRGRARQKTETPEDTNYPDVSGGNAPAGDSTVFRKCSQVGKSAGSEGVGGHVLGDVDANDGGNDGIGDRTILQLLSRDRRLEGRGAAAVVFSELERLCGATSRAPELLNASNALHQELGVVILERAIEGSIGEEPGKGEESAGRSKHGALDEGCRQDERRYPHPHPSW